MQNLSYENELVICANRFDTEAQGNSEILRNIKQPEPENHNSGLIVRMRSSSITVFEHG